jgi:hypothetical protein
MRLYTPIILVLVVMSWWSSAGCTVDSRMKHLVRGSRTDRQWYATRILPAKAGYVPVRADAPTKTAGKVAPGPAAEIPPEERSILAVMDIEDTSGSVDKNWLDNAGEMLRGKLSATGYFVVIDKSRQQEKLKQIVRDQKKESYKACYDQQCQVPLGQALAADSILRTTISCLGDACMLSSELVDLEKEAAVSGGTADFNNSASELKTAIDSVVEQLKLNYR